MNVSADIKGYRYEERPGGRAVLWMKVSVNGWKPKWCHILSAGGPEDEWTVEDLKKAAAGLQFKVEGLND